MLWLSLFLGEAAGGSVVSKPVWDRGAWREFELARDELHTIGAGRPSTLLKIPPCDTLEQLREHGRRMGATTGQEMELVLYEAGRPPDQWSRRLLTRRVLIKLDSPSKAELAGAAANTKLTPLFPELPEWFAAKAADIGGALDLAERLRALPSVRFAQAELAGKAQKKLIPNDPFFPNQWHLRNTGQNGGTAGIDINVAETWDRYRGAGVVIGIVDDGLQYTHPDLAPNYEPSLSYDFNLDNPDPSPDPTADTHGTPVAGLAGARGNNGLGVSGVAPEATLAGLRLLGDYDTDAQDAAAALYRNDSIWVKNNSWGAVDGSGKVEGPGPLLADALAAATSAGRGGKGTIFVFAAGNGLTTGDNANYDGFANSVYTLAVSAVSDRGEQASYSEPGACLLVAAPSGSGPLPCSGGRQRTTTTDLAGADGYNDGATFCDLPDPDFTERFDGTSAAAPIVSGAVALVLQANPELSYRDVAEILMRSATKISPADADWWTNSAGIAHNHKFGAGLVNVGAAVALATNWLNLGPMQTLGLSQTNLAAAIPDNNPVGITRTLTVTNEGFRVERAALTVTAPHQQFGNLTVTLVSPSGTRSRLAERHASIGPGYQGWTFTSVRHWGEMAKGNWTVQVADVSPSYTGTLQRLELQLQGSSPRISLALAAANPGIRLTAIAPAPGSTCGLETSTDLVAWQTVAELTLNEQGRAVFQDTNGGDSARFYRARLAEAIR